MTIPTSFKKPFMLPQFPGGSPVDHEVEKLRPLGQRYKDERYVSREPFLINRIVDGASAASELRRENVDRSQVFMGIAGFKSLDLLSVAGSSNANSQGYHQAILFDNNEMQVKAMNAVLHMVMRCETPEAFRAEFTKNYLPWVKNVPGRYNRDTREKIRADPTHKRYAQIAEDDSFFAVVGRSHIPETRLDLQEELDKTTGDANSWLQPKNYERIRNLALHKRIAVATLDLTDEKRFGLIRDYMEQGGYTLGHAYLSTALGILSDFPHPYHNKEEREEHDPLKAGFKAFKNLSAIGDSETRYLISDPAPKGFAVKSYAGVEVDQALRVSRTVISTMKKNDRPSHTSFAFRKRTFTIEDALAAQSFSREDCAAKLHRSCGEGDHILVLRPDSNLRGGTQELFTQGEIEAIGSVLIPYEHKNAVAWGCVAREGGAAHFLVHIPAAQLERNPALNKKIAADLQQAFAAVSPREKPREI